MVNKYSSASVMLGRLILRAKSEIDMFKKVFVNLCIFFLCNAFTTCFTNPLLLSLYMLTKKFQSTLLV